MADTTCVQCKEAIREGATRCPHCQSFQSKRFPFDGGHGIKALWIVLPSMVVLFSILFAVTWVIQEKPFAAERQWDAKTSLSVAQSDIVTFMCENKCYVAVIGRLENKSPRTWGDVSFHVDCMDKGGNIIDNCSFVDQNIVVPPRQETTFRFLFTAVRDRESYSTHKLEIRWAKHYQ